MNCYDKTKKKVNKITNFAVINGNVIWFVSTCILCSLIGKIWWKLVQANPRQKQSFIECEHTANKHLIDVLTNLVTKME